MGEITHLMVQQCQSTKSVIDQNFVVIIPHLFAMHEDADIEEMVQKEHHFTHSNETKKGLNNFSIEIVNFQLESETGT